MINCCRFLDQQEGFFFESNDELQGILDKGLLKVEIDMFVQQLLNKLQSPERQLMLP